MAGHSGLAQVARTLPAERPRAARPWLTCPLGRDPVRALAAALAAYLPAPADVRAAVRAAMVPATRRRYGWEGVARGVLAAARGELDDLPPP